MLTRTYATTPTEPIASTSSQSRKELRWFGNAAIAFGTLAVSVLSPVTAWAQQTESTYQPDHRVAVIDVAYIFKNLSTIKTEISKIEGDLKKYDAELKQKRDTLKQSVAQLKTLKVNTADYARQEEHVATLESKLRLDMARKQKELREAEARIYFHNYQQIAAAVKAIATHNNIQLVLRFNSEEMDLEQSESVARAVMKNVVFHDGTINMTNAVMRYLEQQTKTSQTATGGNAALSLNR